MVHVALAKRQIYQFQPVQQNRQQAQELTILIYILWLQALIHMIEPHLVPVLHNVIEKLDSLAKLDKKEVKKDLKTVLTDVLDIIELIDVPILKLCVEIESRMPSYVKPLAGTVQVF